MNGVTNNNTTQTTQEPKLVPIAGQAQPTVVQPTVPQQVQPVAQPTVQAPAQPTPVEVTPPAPQPNSLGDNVVIAPPQEGPINASTGNSQEPSFAKPQQPSVAPEPQPVEATQPTPTPTEQPQVEEQQVNVEQPIPPKKSGGKGLLLIIILILIALNVYQYLNTQSQVNKMNFECTPVSTYEKEKELDLKSTIVQDLYNKVETSMREDLAVHEFNDSLKRYLAFRQIPTKDFYDSNCNYFNNTAMQLYTCPTSKDFHPLAIKVETFEREYKKLFGANTTVPNDNIQLGNKCLGGYQYIPDRGEYVQGKCSENVPTSFKKEQKLVKAISRNNVIIISEEVVYKGTDSQTVPEYLKNGTFTYTFKLDTNYNYVYVSREFTPKY